MAALFAAAGLLLAIGGLTKAVWPEPASEALRATGLPSSLTVVRAMAGAETVLGILAVLTGARPLAALVGAAYLAFAAFVVLAIRNRGGTVRSCGCFGADDAPPGPVHVAVDVILAAIAIAAAARGVDGLPDAISLPYVAVAALLTYVGYASLTALPRVLADRAAQPRPRTTVAPELAGEAHRTVLVFLTTTCLTCREIWPRLAPLEDARVIAVTKGPEIEDRDRVRELTPRDVEFALSTETWERYGVTVAPAVVVVDGETGAITTASTIRSWDDVSSSSRP